MCTSVSKLMNGVHIFGRNLDLDCKFGEGIVTVPRGYTLPLRHKGDARVPLGFAGIGSLAYGYPLLAEGMNEAGVCAAALNFPTMEGYAAECKSGKTNLAPFEIIPYLLGNCKTLWEVREALKGVSVIDTPFSSEIRNTKMHFHMADKTGSVTLEVYGGRVQVYENPYGTLSNAPAFPHHLDNMALYRHLSSEQPRERGTLYTNGVGALGLPGDYTSPSRFVRAAWLLERIEADRGLEEAALYSVLRAVAVPRGAVKRSDGRAHFTRYTSLLYPEARRYTVFFSETVSPRVYKIEKELLSGSSPSILHL